VLDTFSLEDLKTELGSFIDGLAGIGTQQNTFLRGVFYNNLKHGVQIRRVCASCIDDVPEDVSPELVQGFCGSDIYGSNMTYSGLLIIPTTADGQAIVPGTHIGNLDMHPTTTTTEVPSFQWTGREESSASIWFYLAVSSTQSLVFLGPDYMGYAESAADSYKGYIVRKSYETSIVPLWWKTKAIIREETNCQSALANAAILSGYSEGGYVSVVAASALARLGVEIINVQSGGAPYRIGSESALGIIESIDGGTFSRESFYILALLGASYSSTYASIANYQKTQDLLGLERRQLILDLVSNPETNQSIFEVLGDIVIGTGIEGFVQPDFLQTFRQAIADGNRDPCQTLDNLEDRKLHFLCQAFLENDLIEMLEAQVDFPVEVCHSPDDDVVPYANVPDFSSNPNLGLVPGVTGSHLEAGEYCILLSLNFAATSGMLQSFPVTPLEEGSCPIPTLQPSAKPLSRPSSRPSSSETTIEPSTLPMIGQDDSSSSFASSGFFSRACCAWAITSAVAIFM
jgi:pimeloyl-ACP methyl ester carboxylesterase